MNIPEEAAMDESELFERLIEVRNAIEGGWPRTAVASLNVLIRDRWGTKNGPTSTGLTPQVIPDDAVWRAGCTDCDWRYYTLSESRAHVWAISHSDEEEGHAVEVAALKKGESE